MAAALETFPSLSWAFLVQRPSPRGLQGPGSSPSSPRSSDSCLVGISAHYFVPGAYALTCRHPWSQRGSCGLAGQRPVAPWCILQASLTLLLPQCLPNLPLIHSATSLFLLALAGSPCWSLSLRGRRDKQPSYNALVEVSLSLVPQAGLCGCSSEWGAGCVSSTHDALRRVQLAGVQRAASAWRRTLWRRRL